MSPAQVLQGQRAIVTGGSSGIGAAIAKAFGAAGAKVGVNYASNARDAQLMVEEIRKGGSEAIALGADVSDEAQVKAMFERFVGEYGGVDIVVANAGIQIDASFAQMEVEQFNRVLHVNLTGQFLCAREAVREFRRRGVVDNVSAAAGKLVFMSSVHQEIPWAGHVNYASSKGGVMQLMRSSAQEVAPFGIRANGVAPGAVRTPINRAAWDTAEAYDRLMTLVPYGRIGEPEDIAQAVSWLVSDAADYVTGATLFVDGA